MPAISRERDLLQKQGLDIRYREEWGARFNYNTDRTVTSVADDFFLHIAVMHDLGDTQFAEDATVRNIENVGIQRFPNTGFSYNAVAFNTGRLYEGQPLTRRGAHTYNDFHRWSCPTHGGSLTSPIGDKWNLNYNVRALVLPQMVDDPVTDDQIDSAARWAAALIRSGLAKPTARWHGHRDVSAKSCPGDRGYREIPELDRLTAFYVKNGLGETMSWSTKIKNFKSQGGDVHTAKFWLMRIVNKSTRADLQSRAANDRLRNNIQPKVNEILNRTRRTEVKCDAILKAVREVSPEVAASVDASLNEFLNSSFNVEISVNEVDETT